MLKRLIITLSIIFITFPSLTDASSLQDEFNYYEDKLREIEKEIESVEDRAKLIELVREENKIAAYYRAYKKALNSVYGVTMYDIDYSNPLPHIELYKSAATQYSIDWALLAAVHDVETSFSTHPTMVSSAGALGHMQFMPGTWDYYGVDADGDGKADPFSLIDAIYSAANYLAASGAANGDITKALFAYNRSISYGLEVMEKANRYKEIEGE